MHNRIRFDETTPDEAESWVDLVALAKFLNKHPTISADVQPWAIGLSSTDDAADSITRDNCRFLIAAVETEDREPGFVGFGLF